MKSGQNDFKSDKLGYSNLSLLGGLYGLSQFVHVFERKKFTFFFYFVQLFDVFGAKFMNIPAYCIHFFLNYADFSLDKSEVILYLL